MAWNVKNPIDYSASGDDIDSFSLKVKNELEVIYELLNRLRTSDAGSGTSVTDAVAYALRVDTSTNPPTIYMRNGQNTGYVAIGKLAENMGIDAASVGGVKTDGFGKLSRGTEADLPSTASSYDVYFATDTKRVYMYLSGSWQVFASLNFGDMENVNSTVVARSEVAASGAGKIPRLDADSGEGQFSITGSAAKIQGYPINTPGLKSDQVLVYNDATKRWENKDRTSGTVTTDEVANGGAGKVLRTDSNNVAHVDISGTAAKIAGKVVDAAALKENDVLAYDSAKDEFVNRPGVTLNSAGVADISITGNAAKVGGKVFQFTDLQDGQIPVYRESANAFVGENKGTVGVGKALDIVHDGKTVGSYDGNTHVIANVDTYGLRQDTTTYGAGDAVTGKTLPPDKILICSTAGKSGDTEPDLSKAADGSSVTDGTVVWIVRAFETVAGLTEHNANTVAHADIRKAVTDGDAATLASAKSDAQAKASAALTSAESYTNTALNTHNTANGTHADIRKAVTDGDAATLASAKSYADTSRTNAEKNAATAASKLYLKSASTDGGIFTFTRGDGTTQAVTVVADNAAAHNAIYRGKDLTNAWKAGTVSAHIKDGTFHDIFPGDYINMPIVVDGVTIQVKWLIADLDYELYTGDSALTTHHVDVVPQDVLNVNTRMCATDDTTGGYVASEMWTKTIPKYVTAIQNAFGSGHVLKHRELLTNEVSASAPAGGGAGWVGSSSGWAWYDVYVNLMNENMVYGGRVWGSGYDIGERTSQLALFHLNPSARIAGYRGNRTDRKWYWLTAVASVSRFAFCDGRGDASYHVASYADGYSGLRPHFLLY